MKDYRIITPRPIAGRMRQVGEVVALDDRQHAAEAPWGGLEPLEPEPPAKAKKTADKAD